ncbi:DUF4199 domain-containing protein [Phaeodactylibacter luteus]|uniref:DUF4199 domain-containing protein n=1 Tax=Phaeodactylibacter luteus TaxID=1564516 RepID=A0A5C6RLJ0_9BACT|nr:DUF4199 domain-containing protein [Phaeodactylibacter luteus]TXB62824.1 DUF4199 domain-containing protein [Phaeodactylibacter luteus]
MGKLLQNRSVRYGLIAGLAVVAIYFVAYLINKEWVFNSFLHWATVGLYVAAAWKAVEDERQAQEGGKLDLKEGIRAGFAVLVVSSLLYYVYYFVLHGLADPGLADVQAEVMREVLEARKAMLSEEQYEAFSASLNEESLRVTLPNTLLTYARSLIGYFLLALALAFIASRR